MMRFDENALFSIEFESKGFNAIHHKVVWPGDYYQATEHEAHGLFG